MALETITMSMLTPYDPHQHQEQQYPDYHQHHHHFHRPYEHSAPPENTTATTFTIASPAPVVGGVHVTASSGNVLRDYVIHNTAATFAAATNGTAGNMGEEDEELQRQLLRAIDDQKATLLLPAVLVILVLMLMGLVGNPLAIYIYGWRWQTSSTRVFLFALAVIDLLNCLITIPTEVAIMRNVYSFRSDGLCKASRFTTYVLNNATSTIFLAISIDRYIRICHPYRRAFTARRAKVACGVGLIIGLAVGWPALFLYGRVELLVPVVPEEGRRPVYVAASMCLVHAHMKEYSLAFFIYLCTAVFICVLILVFFYTLIGRDILKRKKLSRMRKEATAATLESLGGHSGGFKASGSQHNHNHHHHHHHHVSADATSNDARNGTVPILAGARAENNGLATSVNDSSRPPTPSSSASSPCPSPCPSSSAGSGILGRRAGGGSGAKREKTVVMVLPTITPRTTTTPSTSTTTATTSTTDTTTSTSNNNDDRNDDEEEEEGDAATNAVVADGGDAEEDAPKGCNVQHISIRCKKLRPPRATLMLFLITVVFITSFLPFLIISIIREDLGPGFYLGLSPKEEVAVNIFIRSYIVNNCTNPIVYGLCNSQFRRECRRLYLRLCRRGGRWGGGGGSGDGGAGAGGGGGGGVGAWGASAGGNNSRHDSFADRSRTVYETPMLERKAEAQEQTET